MTYILIQIRRNACGVFDSTTWHNVNPNNLQYDDFEHPFLYLHMQLGHTIEAHNQVYFDNYDKITSYQNNVANNPYIKEKQILLATSGVNRKNFPFLQKFEADAIQDLAFADTVFANYLKTKQVDEFVQKQYNSVVKFEEKQ